MKVTPEAYLMPLIERISSGERYDSRSLDNASNDVYCESLIIILMIMYTKALYIFLLGRGSKTQLVLKSGRLRKQDIGPEERFLRGRET